MDKFKLLRQAVKTYRVNHCDGDKNEKLLLDFIDDLQGLTKTGSNTPPCGDCRKYDSSCRAINCQFEKHQIVKKNQLDPFGMTWVMIQTSAYNDYHHALYRCERYGVQQEIITPKNPETGEFGRPKVYYFIDDCDKEITSIEDLVDTWNDLKSFDDPDNKIVWIRKTIKKH